MILVVAAVEQELQGAAGARTLCCGIGPVRAAAATAAALAGSPVRAVVHVGIAGMRPDAGLALLDAVIGDEAVDEDRAAQRVSPDPRLLAAARRALPGAAVRSIGTSARVGGTSACGVEAMEGYAVLRAAELAGVPAIEVRVISNAIEEADRELWRFDEAFAAVAALTPPLVEEVRRCVS